MAVPQSQNNEFDDLTAIEADVNTLYNTYVRPIDGFRSNSRPSALNEASVAFGFFRRIYDPKDPVESRVHAFYRVLGMPVVSKEAGFYSPGYNPRVTEDEVEKQGKVYSAIYNEKKVANFIYEREKYIFNFQKIFSVEENLKSIVFCLCSRHSFPFAVFDPAIDHLDEDKQIVTIDDRQAEALFFGSNNPDEEAQILSYGDEFSKVLHAIKPFVVDPKMESWVEPDDKIICAPFLTDDNDCLIKKNVRLKSPIMQDILLARLEDSVVGEDFLKRIQDILDSTTENKGDVQIDYPLLYSTVSTLTELSTLPDDVKAELSEVTNIQFNTVKKLFKTIKVLVKKLAESQAALDDVKSRINWVPLPNQNINGPVSGGKLFTTYKNFNIDVDIKIAELEIRKANAETAQKARKKIGVSISPFGSNAFSEKIKNYNKGISDLKAFRDGFAAEGFEALKNIEIIKGEIAGIGLIDILAIYIGLWSLPIDDLLMLFDDAAIQRLNSAYVHLQGSKPLQDRLAKQAGSSEVLSALEALEDKVFYILSFADSYYLEITNPQEYSNSSTE